MCPRCALPFASFEDAWHLLSVWLDMIKTNDTSICLNFMEHVHQRNRRLAAICRAPRAGRTMRLSVRDRGNSWKRLREWAGLYSYSDTNPKIEETTDELGEELGKNVFRVVHLHPSVYDSRFSAACEAT
jgi:hypothetical protein